MQVTRDYGITVTTASASAATNVIVSTRPPVRARRCADHNPSAISPRPCFNPPNSIKPKVDLGKVRARVDGG